MNYDQSLLAEETVIVFSSDNGGNMYDGYFDVSRSPEEKAAAIEHLAEEIRRSELRKPLMIFCGGGVQVPYAALKLACKKGGLVEDLQAVTFVSHRIANERTRCQGHPEYGMNWSDLVKLSPYPTFIDHTSPRVNAGKNSDITEILKAEPGQRPWGNPNSFHFWGEPEYGYYHASDPWVIRHDMQMLTHAGLDFIVFDVTDALTYGDTVKQVLKVSAQMREEGIASPAISFLTNAKSSRTMNQLYDEIYAKALYPELWFQWQGKPLIMGKADNPQHLEDVTAFFLDGDAAPDRRFNYRY